MEPVQERTRRLFGVAVILPVAAAVVTAAWVATGITPWLAVGYLAACSAAGVVILWAFCARCPCAGRGCGHVVPGPLAKLLFPHRTPGRYAAAELGLTGLALVVVLGTPTLWLWQTIPVLVGFWVAVGLALIPIRLVVCRGCGNGNCPGHPGATA